MSPVPCYFVVWLQNVNPDVCGFHYISFGQCWSKSYSQSVIMRKGPRYFCRCHIKGFLKTSLSSSLLPSFHTFFFFFLFFLSVSLPPSLPPHSTLGMLNPLNPDKVAQRKGCPVLGALSWLTHLGSSSPLAAPLTLSALEDSGFLFCFCWGTVA